MKKILPFLAIAVVFLSSCGQGKSDRNVIVNSCGISLLDEKYAFFCTPTNPHLCKPLVIINTSNGWVARYGADTSTDSLLLQPVRGLDDDGDSMFYLAEYYEGRLNGTYRFDKDYWDMDGICNRMYYTPEGSDKSVEFMTYSVSTYVVRNNPFLLGDSAFEVQGYELYCEHAGDKARRLLYEIYIDSRNTLRKGLNYDDVYTSMSSDGKMRYYNLYYQLCGNGHGNLIDFSAMQYSDKGSVYYISNFNNVLFDMLEEEGSFTPNFAHGDTSAIYVANINGKTYYLVETRWWDEMPMPIEGEFMQNEVVSLTAFRISGGKMEPVNLFNGAPIMVRVADKVTRGMHFRYDDATKTLSIPLINPDDYSFRGEYETLRL